MSVVKRWLGVVKSVMASFIGVQSQSQYAKDASGSSFVPFIVVGVIMVILLVLSIWFGVSLLLPSS
ncbi:MAG: ABC-type arginine transport system permease subunit [Yoonia sp.]|jgi:ABC-type arginine transport system permease subunit